MKRRDFIKLIATLTISAPIVKALTTQEQETDKSYAFVVDVNKCIGCGNCVIACKVENDVPMDLPIARTWVEGYSIDENVPLSKTKVQKIVMNTAKNPFLDKKNWRYSKNFLVPKLCNHCANAPCVNVCPVYARFHTKEGVVLVDKNTCIGCKYCIVACPYGATFLNPEEKVTDKCTFCFHRITKGLKPACVEVCPTGARSFGDLNDKESIVYKILKEKEFSVLKPEEGTLPRVFYLGLEEYLVE
ncbi:4Fe-4S dicluster domain-containing protein [Archaeoglobales archaeon]|nr:MAG: 4Fe-4S dicluster domain-containing protein [Archaeoglobales archaeon]